MGTPRFKKNANRKVGVFLCSQSVMQHWLFACTTGAEFIRIRYRHIDQGSVINGTLEECDIMTPALRVWTARLRIVGSGPRKSRGAVRQNSLDFKPWSTDAADAASFIGSGVSQAPISRAGKTISPRLAGTAEQLRSQPGYHARINRAGFQ